MLLIYKFNRNLPQNNNQPTSSGKSTTFDFLFKWPIFLHLIEI